MKDLDFSAISTLQPEAAVRAAQVAVQSPHYEPALAQDFFRVAGTQEELDDSGGSERFTCAGGHFEQETVFACFNGALQRMNRADLVRA